MKLKSIFTIPPITSSFFNSSLERPTFIHIFQWQIDPYFKDKDLKAEATLVSAYAESILDSKLF